MDRTRHRPAPWRLFPRLPDLLYGGEVAQRADTQARAVDRLRYTHSAERAVSEAKPIEKGEFSAVVARAESGDTAANDALFSTLYDELHRLAESHIRRSAGPITMGATTLLHEAYVNLSGRHGVDFPDERRFLKYASRAMRGLVINYVQRRRAQKRGGEITFTDLDEVEAGAAADGVRLEQLGHALEELAAVDASLAELVDLKFFCGFSFSDIAALRGVSERTVQRDWAKARLVLHDALNLENGTEGEAG